MNENIKFIFRHISEKLWFRPLIFCIFSILAAFMAQFADNSFLRDIAPEIKQSSLEDLLSTLSSSMLVIAIFAVGAMLSAFSAASNTATPRSFKLVVADDVSQNALSVFIGSFIYSIVASVALKNGYYGKAGYFTLFVLTLTVFVVVIITFLRWVERISKLGRQINTIEKIEETTTGVIRALIEEPLMGGTPVTDPGNQRAPVFGNKIGYVQHINMSQLQELALETEVKFLLNCIPGSFTAPEKPLLYIASGEFNATESNIEKLNKSFIIDNNRSFYNDPRFGLIALNEIASRALSPGINDPGTAIAILGTYVRLFTLWTKKERNPINGKAPYNRVEVPAISLSDMFDDAFRPIARDGAGNLEVMIRLQKALLSISHTGTAEIKEIAAFHSRQAFERAELAMQYPGDLETLRKVCKF